MLKLDRQVKPARSKIVAAVAVAAAAVIAVVACGEARPGNLASGDTDDPMTGACAHPQEGCSCTVGAEAPCGFEVKGEEHFVYCAKGVRTCETGAWGACVPDGEMSVSSRSVSLSSAPSGIQLQALGAPVACSTLEGGVNPCDPYCQVTNDTPVGFDAGPGFTVRDGGLIVAGCGDGVLRGAEECDDGNNVSGDGCSNSCVLEMGFQCPVPGARCTTTTCGNNTREGAEQCDDGNLRPYDGCSPTCQLEAVCPGGTCVAVCGDGLKFPSEQCDDGNLRDGDGCSSTCTIETGASCVVETTALPPSINVPVIYRDFTPTTNPDFEKFCCGVTTGIVQNNLAADGKPAFLAARGMVTNAASFYEWYHDSSNSRIIYDTLTLTKQPDDSYVFSSNAFFPLNGRGYGNYGTWGLNFHFTSELRYPFTYHGGEVLEFVGDDDVFVFINGRLAVDIGGVHGAAPGSVTLNATRAAALGLTVGGNYEIAVFQAERRTSESNYRLTLRGFERARSACSFPQDNVVVRDFEAVCPPGQTGIWQLFRWRAAVPANTSIDFRAATAATQAALPAAPDPAPTTVGIGSATPANSPAPGPAAWASYTEGAPPAPVPVSRRLREEANTASQAWLRVFMTFNPQANTSPRLDEWQQLYSCVPTE
ncbi:MAG: fibro-slime domain-containing protein [Labilithrix sp.]|nr:fibro-slime domain-containing protein [Labilithrix sp.]